MVKGVHSIVSAKTIFYRVRIPSFPDTGSTIYNRIQPGCIICALKHLISNICMSIVRESIEQVRGCIKSGSQCIWCQIRTVICFWILNCVNVIFHKTLFILIRNHTIVQRRCIGCLCMNDCSVSRAGFSGFCININAVPCFFCCIIHCTVLLCFFRISSCRGHLGNNIQCPCVHCISKHLSICGYNRKMIAKESCLRGKCSFFRLCIFCTVSKRICLQIFHIFVNGIHIFIQNRSIAILLIQEIWNKHDGTVPGNTKGHSTNIYLTCFCIIRWVIR